MPEPGFEDVGIGMACTIRFSAASLAYIVAALSSSVFLCIGGPSVVLKLKFLISNVYIIAAALE